MHTLPIHLQSPVLLNDPKTKDELISVLELLPQVKFSQENKRSDGNTQNDSRINELATIDNVTQDNEDPPKREICVPGPRRNKRFDPITIGLFAFTFVTRIVTTITAEVSSASSVKLDNLQTKMMVTRDKMREINEDFGVLVKHIFRIPLNFTFDLDNYVHKSNLRIVETFEVNLDESFHIHDFLYPNFNYSEKIHYLEPLNDLVEKYEKGGIIFGLDWNSMTSTYKLVKYLPSIMFFSSIILIICTFYRCRSSRRKIRNQMDQTRGIQHEKERLPAVSCTTQIEEVNYSSIYTPPAAPPRVKWKQTGKTSRLPFSKELPTTRKPPVDF